MGPDGSCPTTATKNPSGWEVGKSNSIHCGAKAPACHGNGILTAVPPGPSLIATGWILAPCGHKRKYTWWDNIKKPQVYK